MSQTETKPKATKPKATKKTTKQEQAVAPQMEFSPELMAQFMQFMAMQQQMQQVKQEPIIEEEKKEKVIDKRYLKTIKDREVRVTSCNRTVIYKSKKTGEITKWLDTGDDEYLTVEEILSMDNQSKSFLRNPWLLIDDEEVVEGLGLSDLYHYINKVQDLDSFFSLPISEIEDVCNKLPKQFKSTLANEVDKKIENQELRDVLVIRTLEDVLGKTFDV